MFRFKKLRRKGLVFLLLLPVLTLFTIVLSDPQFILGVSARVSGDVQWVKTYGGSKSDWAESVQQSSDGGYIVAGGTYSFGAGGCDIYLIKTDSSGNEQWEKTFGGSLDDWATSVQQTSDGGYIIAGPTSSFGAGGDDVYLVKTDFGGNEQWEKTFGGSLDDWATSVQQTSDGGYIITGDTYSFGAGMTDVYLVRTDSSGNMLWYKTFGGSRYGDSAFSVQQTSDGGYIIAGDTSSFGDGKRVYLVRTDSSGNMLWYKTFGGSGHDEAFSVQQTSDGGYIIAEDTYSRPLAGSGDVYLIKLSAEKVSLTLLSDYGSISGAGNYTLGSTAIFSVSPTTVTNGSRRYIFTGWTSSSQGGYTGGNSSVTVTMNNEIVERANWKTQCFLTLNSSIGMVTGDGWYDAGSTATFNVSSTIVTAGSGTRYVFAGWKSSSPAGYTNSQTPVKATASVVMNGGISEVANWKTQYFLTLNSSLGMVTGDGWYDAGSTATFSVSQPTVTGDTGSRYAFAGWKSNSPRGYTGSQNPVKVVMNSDITQVAEWKTQYLLTVLGGSRFSVKPTSATSDYWFDTGTQVSVSTNNVWSEVSEQSRTRATQYQIDSNAPVPITSPSGTTTSAAITMNSPHMITFSSAEQYYLKVTSQYNISGQGWYDRGSTANLNAGASQGFPVRQVLSEWSGDVQSRSQTVSITMDGSKKVVAVWTTDYGQLYMLVGALGTVTMTVTVLAHNHRRTQKKRRAREALKHNLLSNLGEANDARSIRALSERYEVSEAAVRELIDEAVREGILKGAYTRDGLGFMTERARREVLKNRLLRKLGEVDVVSISGLAMEYGTDEALVRQLITEAVKKGDLAGTFTSDNQSFVSPRALKRIIGDKLQ